MRIFRTPKLMLLTFVAAAIIVAGCGSSNSSKSSASTNNQNSSAAASTPAATTGASGSFNLAAIKADAKKFASDPTQYTGPTEPVKAPKGIKLALVPCSAALTGCVTPLKAAAAIAKQLGWSTTFYNAQDTPSSENAAVQQAIVGGANAILLGADNPAFIGSALQTAESKGIPVGSLTQDTPPVSALKFDISANWPMLGQMLGDWIIADSNAKAVVLPFNDKTFASTVQYGDAVNSTLATCKTCKVYPTQFFVGTDIATSLGPNAVGLLRQHSDIDYIQGAYDPAAAAIVPAVANAGFGSKVKVTGANGGAQNLALVKACHIQVVDAAFDQTYQGYMAMYQIIRLLDHQPLWTTPGVTNPEFKFSGNVPMRLFTCDSPPQNTGVAWDDNSAMQYEAKFNKLFGLG